MKEKKPLIKGFEATHKNPKPPASSPGFVYPARPNPAVALAFRTSLIELMREKGLDFHALAIELFGTHYTKAGGQMANAISTVRKWVMGQSYAVPAKALLIAAYFNVPVERLLTPKGRLQPMMLKRAREGSDPALRPDAAGAVAAPPKAKSGPKPRPEPPERLPLPEGAKPAIVKFETHPADPRFASIEVKGTLQMDHVLSLVALIHG